MEELLHWSHAQSDNVPDTMDTVRANDIAKPIQAEVEAPPLGPSMEAPQSKADVHVSSEGRKESCGLGNESETVETRRFKRAHRAVSTRCMTWSWLEPDGAALRMRNLCRQGRLLLAQWRGLCVRACSKPPGMPQIWPETASDEASTSIREGVGDCWRELREAYAVPSEDDPDFVSMRARKEKAHHRCRPSRASAGRSSLPSF